MHRGYIRLWRKITEWEWYDDVNTFRLFIHLLLHANHEDKKWKGIIIKRGQFLTSREKLAKILKISIQQLRTSEDRLKSTNEITNKTTNKYSLYMLINYNHYNQDNKQGNKQITNKEQTNNKQITTTKHYKHYKHEEVITKVIEQAQNFGNEKINEMLKTLKEKIGIDDFADAQKWSRIYARHLVGLIKKIGKDEFTERLNIILKDNFKRKNCNRIKYLYGELKSMKVKNILNDPYSNLPTI